MVLSVAALVLGGLDAPGIGFPVAVGILTGFGVVSSPPLGAPPTVRRVVRGGVTTGGMKQGAFVKAMFAAALFYQGSHPVLFTGGEPVIPALLLGIALLSSSVGTALEAHSITRSLRSTADRSVRTERRAESP